MTTTASARLAPVLERTDRNLDASIDRLCAFLRIPSISTDPAYDAETRKAAEWASERLSELGFESR
ncbi:MAG: hypothetical protein ACO3YY_09270, partial [Phycisphaerales bacterium]